jgi:hypothetical protein
VANSQFNNFLLRKSKILLAKCFGRLYSGNHCPFTLGKESCECTAAGYTSKLRILVRCHFL